MLDIETISQAKKEVQGDMSYAIVRNEKLTRAEVNGKGTHNDRKAKNHSNKEIDISKSHLNYYFKKNELSYKDLKMTCNTSIFDFETTEELEPIQSGTNIHQRI